MTPDRDGARNRRPDDRHLHARRGRPAPDLRRRRPGSRTIRTGAICCCSTSTSTATTAPGSAPSPDGLDRPRREPHRRMAAVVVAVGRVFRPGMFLVLLLHACLAHAQTIPNQSSRAASVQGVVRTADGRPVAGVQVELRQLAPSGRPVARGAVRQALTTAEGIFRILDLAAGDYSTRRDRRSIPALRTLGSPYRPRRARDDGDRALSTGCRRGPSRCADRPGCRWATTAPRANSRKTARRTRRPRPGRWRPARRCSCGSRTAGTCRCPIGTGMASAATIPTSPAAGGTLTTQTR